MANYVRLDWLVTGVIMPACYGNEEGDQRSLWTSQLIPDISLSFSFPGRSSNGTCGERWVVNPCHYHHHHHHHKHLSWASVSERLTQWPRPDEPNERAREPQSCTWSDKHIDAQFSFVYPSHAHLTGNQWLPRTPTQSAFRVKVLDLCL